MGLFSRNESASRPERRPASRSALSSEAQANELRSRARSRLIGALVLVLAAVVIVPMLFDSPTEPEQPATPVVVPSIQPPSTDPGSLAANTPADQGQVPTPAQPDANSGMVEPDSNASGQAADAGATEDAERTDDAIQAPETSPEPAAKPEPKPEPKPKPESKPEPKPKSEPKPAAGDTQRTDDGSRALAILQGKVPPKPAASAPERGNYVLQIAAYSTEADAQSRRDKLASAGVTNAYVQKATSHGKPTYRLRVGPFPTHDAAQAAQARLRALGYDNGFISSQ
ncbi:SPOR domain-containing protein [Allopusillimonas soli]|uniref:SPOR domain-containing protein n=2 Tax=Allopusillimonas soli TaxID=659016 RepID=A0A853F9A6_9BURK|nr:SPOR domain-containing protein [Allopusillimonas soli]NYT36673.1 SPOR domain-containing protein [Allopusillimonas soli]TEA75616.1 SPOR domain-containing protein [Allopusillimonas soli]